MDAAHPSYGKLLERAMERHDDISVTDLARRLAERSGNLMESERATLRTYLHRDKRPNRVKAAMLAEILDEPALAEVRPRDGEIAELRRQIAELRDALRRAGLLPPGGDGEPPSKRGGRSPR